jgi:hypothetical protein
MRKTVLYKATRDELIARVNTLTADSKPQWGKMNVYQMVKHCILCDEMYQGQQQYPRMFLGRIVGQLALKSLTKDDKPMPKNAQTAEPFEVKEATGDVRADTEKWIALIQGYEAYNNPNFIHWFFGRMTPEQVGILAYKHSDHHLRQFGC